LGGNTIATVNKKPPEKVRVLIVSEEGFDGLSGGAILKFNLFVKSGAFRVLSIDCLGRSSGVEHLSIEKHLFGLPRRASSKIKLMPSQGSILLTLQRHLLKVLLGDATRPTLLLGYPSILNRASDFKPDIIYTNFGSTGLNSLVLRLQRDLPAKLVIHFMDDWHRGRNSTGLLSKFMRFVLDRQTRSLLRNSTLRFVISEGMRRAFSERFNLDFYVSHNSVDLTGWLRKDFEYYYHLESSYKIRYVGTVLSDVQLDGLALLASRIQSINNLKALQKPIELEVYSSSRIPFVASSFERWCDCVKFKLAPKSDEKFFFLLKTAAAIFLPMPLDTQQAKYVRYSLSAKLPAYLLSGAPIIYCGSNDIYQSELLRSLVGCYSIGGCGVDGYDERVIVNAIQEDRESFRNERAEFVARNFSFSVIEGDFRRRLMEIL
jgi:hypothetical protein